MVMSESEWISAFAARVGQEVPSDAQRDAILALAGVAAHASGRVAAPIACWLAGAAGLSAREAVELARLVDQSASEG
jgi:hypothetical protein